MSPKHDSARDDSGDWKTVIVTDTTKLVALETWRKSNYDKEQEAKVVSNLQQIKNHFDELAAKLNQSLGKAIEVKPFEWKSAKPNDEGEYWVFGYRAGTGPRKIAVICHLDTVPAGSDDWDPFSARVETRIYHGCPSDFLIGRGAIDDKGPAVVAFEAFSRALLAAREHSDSPLPVTLEVLFDTSEETDMSTPHYFDSGTAGAKPDFGIVFDAYWSIFAEKGIERPIFTINSADVPHEARQAPFIASLLTSPGSTNMIPVNAVATIHGSADRIASIAKQVETWYRAFAFDDINYHPADIQVASLGHEVTLTTFVAGAQHGSAPHQNRLNGANPLVSLSYFLAYLVDQGVLANNVNGEMARFIRWGFGTRVFGENHPDLLCRFDSVFQQGNGTTYALTQLTADKIEHSKHKPQEVSAVHLALDIRYATGHHGVGWNGSEGQIRATPPTVDRSVFEEVFSQLVARYQSEASGAKVTFSTRTVFGPDIRSTRNPNLFRINNAYRAVMGENCPMYATGGGTDAHGYLELVTAGTLFTTDMGPPVNYHGLDEGAPLIDLENSAKILLYLLQQELATPRPATSHEHQATRSCLH